MRMDLDGERGLSGCKRRGLRGGGGPMGDFGKPLYFSFWISVVQSPCPKPISSQVSLPVLMLR